MINQTHNSGELGGIATVPQKPLTSGCRAWHEVTLHGLCDPGDSFLHDALSLDMK